MNILIITQYFWPENFRINDLVREFCKRGHKVTVLTGLPNYPAGRFSAGYGLRGPYRETYGGGEALRCPVLVRGGGRGLLLALNCVSFAVMATLLGFIACRKDNDVIFVHEPS